MVQNQESNKTKIKPEIYISISDPEDMSVLENVEGKGWNYNYSKSLLPKLESGIMWSPMYLANLA